MVIVRAGDGRTSRSLAAVEGPISMARTVAPRLRRSRVAWPVPGPTSRIAGRLGRAVSSQFQVQGFRLAATLVRKLTRKVYNSDHDYCRNACAVVRSQGSPL